MRLRIVAILGLLSAGGLVGCRAFPGQGMANSQSCESCKKPTEVALAPPPPRIITTLPSTLPDGVVLPRKEAATKTPFPPGPLPTTPPPAREVWKSERWTPGRVLPPADMVPNSSLLVPRDAVAKPGDPVRSEPTPKDRDPNESAPPLELPPVPPDSDGKPAAPKAPLPRPAPQRSSGAQPEAGGIASVEIVDEPVITQASSSDPQRAVVPASGHSPGGGADTVSSGDFKPMPPAESPAAPADAPAPATSSTLKTPVAAAPMTSPPATAPVPAATPAPSPIPAAIAKAADDSAFQPISDPEAVKLSTTFGPPPATPAVPAPPPAKKVYGHTADYKTLTGIVQQWRDTWRLRYAGLDEEDSHGGSVLLVGEGLDALRDGQHVQVQGNLLPAESRGAAPRYHVQAVQTQE